MSYDPLTITNVLINFFMFITAALMVWVTWQSVKATKAVGEISIKPLLCSWIRSAADYDARGGDARDWKPGVGIYVQNIGAGPAVNGTITCVVFGERKTKREYVMNFGRITPGMTYTYPSVGDPQLEIKESDKEIMVQIEYRDIIGKQHVEEPVNLKISKQHFARAPRYSVAK